MAQPDAGHVTAHLPGAPVDLAGAWEPQVYYLSFSENINFGQQIWENIEKLKRDKNISFIWETPSRK